MDFSSSLVVISLNFVVSLITGILSGWFYCLYYYYRSRFYSGLGWLGISMFIALTIRDIVGEVPNVVNVISLDVAVYLTAGLISALVTANYLKKGEYKSYMDELKDSGVKLPNYTFGRVMATGFPEFTRYIETRLKFNKTTNSTDVLEALNEFVEKERAEVQWHRDISIENQKLYSEQTKNGLDTDFIKKMNDLLEDAKISANTGFTTDIISKTEKLKNIKIHCEKICDRTTRLFGRNVAQAYITKWDDSTATMPVSYGSKHYKRGDDEVDIKLLNASLERNSPVAYSDIDRMYDVIGNTLKGQKQVNKVAMWVNSKDNKPHMGFFIEVEGTGAIEKLNLLRDLEFFENIAVAISSKFDKMDKNSDVKTFDLSYRYTAKANGE